MKVSIKRASMLVVDLQEIINKMTIDRTIRYTLGGEDSKIEENLTRRLDDAVNTMHDKTEDLVNIVQLMYNIRKQIGHANHTSGINTIMTDMAELSRCIELLSGNTINYNFDNWLENKNNSIQYLIDDVTAANQMMKAGNSHTSYVTINLMTPEEQDALDEQIAGFKAKRRTLNEQLSELNITQHIEISDDQELVLRNMGVM